MAVLPKLSTGLDVNVRFTGVCDFEYTPECIVFDLLDIPLYHGWLLDPQSPETAAVVGKLSYNQLVEKIIDYKHSADSSRVSEGKTRVKRVLSHAQTHTLTVCVCVCVHGRSGSRAVPGVHGHPAVLSRSVRAQRHGQRGRDLRLLQEQPLQYHDQTQGGAALTPPVCLLGCC